MQNRLSTTVCRWLATTFAAFAITGCASLPAPLDRLSTFAIPVTDRTSIGRLALRSTPDAKLTGVRLLPTGPNALGARTALIERAERTLDLQYYVLQDDATGRRILAKLRDAALRGVRVRLLLDDMHTAGMDEMLIGLAAYPNMEVRVFNPFSAGRNNVVTRFVASAFDFYRVNHRMHNKLFLADGAMAIVGGRNIADAYFMRDPTQNFADIDALMIGAVVTELSDSFDDYWNSEFAIPVVHFTQDEASAEERQRRFEARVADDVAPDELAFAEVDVLGYGPIAEEFDDYRLGLIWGTAHAWVDPTEKIWNCRPVPDGSTAPHLHTVRLRVEALMRSARETVTLSSPYFVPARNGMAIFEESIRSGVSYKVLTNSLAATDEPLVHWGYMRYRKPMLRLGIELFELSPTRANRDRGFGLAGSKSLGSLHAKTAVVDGQSVFIGSMNFDPRSDALNTEVGIHVESPRLAREVLRLMNLDRIQSSYKVRLRSDETLEWVGIDDFMENVRQDEPDAALSTRMYLQFVAPFISERML